MMSGKEKCIAKITIIGCMVLVSLFLLPVVSFAQAQGDANAKRTDDQTSKAFDIMQIHRLLLPYSFSPRVGVTLGYDSNVNLDNARKGDMFEDFALSMRFSKPWLENIKWSEGINFTFNYDLDVLNYNRVTDASNILNHFVFGLNKKYGPFTAGIGHDLGILYYPNNEDGDFIFNKNFIYLRQNIFKKFYHQLRFEGGLKQYTNKHALGDSLNTLQDKKRHDDRYSLDYSIGANLTPALFARWNSRYTVNESNAIYLDFYDYTAIETSAYLEYQLMRRLYLFSKLTFMHKDYSRTVTLRDYEQRDNYYAGLIGGTYQLNKNNALTASYTRRQNYSNDRLEKYFENVFTGGWQYSF
ncbi:MAG: hypothetical protein ABH865_03600 [Candidatus Omnitrophota bacterium]